ncbi:ABC transporter substrate-binding protein [Nocardioides rotundus]|uniref:ABC transporter substrate-binding protein n=1 Tax=Nocardioides rotundus TaxID=1774216 RepID=UPI001CBDF99B|nr:ABC transporter substrate-binding protein [Nocardioides rotundus]UAL30054.1 ABC transporter substrate-binding protein [Nocardioides rotundus]
MNRTRPLAALAALALALTACGSESSSDAGSEPPRESSSASADFPVTVDTPGGEITIDEQPQKIVSLSPSATETLFAIGAGDQVVAADEFSTYPKEAPTTKLSGFEPNVEAIAEYSPDLVVAANDANGMVAGLKKLGVPVLINAAPATIEQGYDSMAALGQATGHVDETADLVKQLRSDIDAALAQAPDRPIRIYHELDDSYYSASSYGFIGSVYEQMGAKNIADAADKDKTGFPQLTEEAIIKADPQLIVITDQVGYDAQDVANRPGWQAVSAVREDNIVTVNADIASRWGPRLPQLIEQVADAMSSVKVPAAG